MLVSAVDRKAAMLQRQIGRAVYCLLQDAHHIWPLANYYMASRARSREASPAICQVFAPNSPRLSHVCSLCYDAGWLDGELSRRPVLQKAQGRSIETKRCPDNAESVLADCVLSVRRSLSYCVQFPRYEQPEQRWPWKLTTCDTPKEEGVGRSQPARYARFAAACQAHLPAACAACQTEHFSRKRRGK